MKQRQRKNCRSGCPISIALEIIGDPWALLIVRDLMFKKRDTFNAFLSAEEGIATNILSDRLARLESNGIITKERDPNDARRFVYRLTGKGIDLAPMLIELVLWSAKYHETDAPAEVIEEIQKNRTRFVARLKSELPPTE